MARALATLALALLVVVAGCQAPLSGGNSPAPTDATTAPSDATATTEPESTATETTTEQPDTPTTTPRATPTPTATPTPEPPQNPWHAETVVVGIDPGPEGRTYEPLVTDAIEYWQTEAAEYSTYEKPVEFQLRPGASDPDLVINFTAQVICGSYGPAAGCAPVLNDTHTAEPPEEMAIETGRHPALVYRTLKHEFGHVLGVQHNREPLPLMAAGHEVDEQVPDVTERDFAFPDTTLYVYLNLSGVDSTTAKHYEREVEHALEYWADGGDGHLDRDIEFVRVDEPHRADIEIRFTDPGKTGDEEVSRGVSAGFNLDGDEAVEYHDLTVITVHGIDQDAIGWHVGHWLGWELLGAESDSELPDVLQRDASYSERRGTWYD